MRFKDKVVLISGGTRGIGKSCAKAFSNEGAICALNYRTNQAEAEKTLALLPGSNHRLYQADLADPAAIEKMTKDVNDELGRIDILVNNAGIHEHHPIDKVDYQTWQDEWNKTIQVNLFGAANLTFCSAQYMINQKHGKIVFVSSRGAFRGEPDQPAYGASKGGINSFGQSMAQKLAPYNISVGLVAPGFVQTEMTADILEGTRGEAIKAQSPYNRVAKPEEVANAVLFLADEKSFWSTGAIIDVNGASYLRT